MVVGGVTLPHFGDGDWMRGDSAWYAAIGVQGWKTGSLWTLFEAPGRHYFNKPPLGLWIEGLWLRVLGIGAWQGRSATVMAAMLCVLVASVIARRLGGRRAGLVGGLLLAVNIEFFRRTREVSLDMWNTLFMLAGAWMVVEAVLQARRGTRAKSAGCVAGAAFGASLLTKPLVGLIGVGLVTLWMAWEAVADRSSRTASASADRSRGEAGGKITFRWVVASAAGILVVAAAVAGPWHWSMVHLHGREFVDAYFGREIAERAGGGLVGGQRELQPPWFYIVNLWSAWTVWLLVLGLVVAIGARRARASVASATHGSLGRLALVWGLGWLVLLSAFSDRRDRYAIPVHAGVALMGAAVLDGRARDARRLTRILPWVVAGGGAVFAAAPVSVQRGVNPQWPELFAWLESQGVGEVWDGSFSGAPGARVYMERGAWPLQTRDAEGNVVATPPPGAIVLYHRRGGWGPGEGEVVVWSKGDLSATRRIAGVWSPAVVEDAGE